MNTNKSPWIDARNGNYLRLDLARRLVENANGFAHMWLCHSDGSECLDGGQCGSPADLGRVDAYESIPDAALPPAWRTRPDD